MDECRKLAQTGEEEIKGGIELLEKALKTGTEDTFLLSAIYSQLGNGYYAIREFPIACSYHANDLLLSRIQNDLVLEFKALCNLSHALAMCGRVDEAVEHAQSVLDRALQVENGRLECAKSVGDRSVQLRTYTNLGNTCVQLGEYEAAIVCYTKGLVMANRDRRRDVAAQLYFYLGVTEALFNRHKEALANHLSHLELARGLNDVAGQARALLHLALCCERLFCLPKAFYFLALHWKLTESLNDPNLQSKARDAVEQMVQRHPEDCVDKEDKVVVEDCSDLCALRNSILNMDGAANAKSVPSGGFLRLSNLSESLESFIADCTKRRRSAPSKRSTVYQVEEGMESEASHSTDCGLERNPTVRPSVSSKDRFSNNDSPDDFFDFLSRMQGNRIDDQRCTADILKDRTNDTARQGDSLSRFEFKSEKKKSVTRRLSKMISRNLNFKASNSSRLQKSSSRPSLSFKKSNSSMINNPLDERHSMISSTSFNRLNSINGAMDFEHCPSPDVSNSSQGLPSVGTFSATNLSIIEQDEEVFQEEIFHTPPTKPQRQKNPEDILDLIMNVQGRRMDEQRADPILPGLSNRSDYVKAFSEQNESKMSERLYEIIMERQSHRLDDQRSELGGRPRSCSDLPECLPDDVSELVIALSAGRIESQRALLKPLRSESDLRVADDGLPIRCASASAAVNLK